MKGAADRIAFAENTSRGVIVLILLYLALIGIIIAFSNVFISLLGANPSAANIALIVAVTLPIALLGVTLFQIVRLLRQRATRQAGAGLRLRLLLFFILIAILSAGPQAMLGITFVKSAMGTWFSSSIGDSLDGAINLAVAYQKERQDNLAAFMDGPLLPRFVQDFTDAPARTWREIQGANSGIGAFQLFGPDGAPIAFQGDAGARQESAPEASGKEDRENVTILRQMRAVTVNGKRVTAVASALLSADLRANVRQLSKSLTVFTTLDQFGRLFLQVLVAFFLLFSLPIFLITILVSLLLTQRIISPIAHLEDATRRVAEGDFGFRILTRPRDELATLVDSFNGMISELERSRRKLLQAERITAWQEIAQRLATRSATPSRRSSSRRNGY
jgi:two-component system, NtrC family, nitrogen regulation sensor histidine kinase NtrY